MLTKDGSHDTHTHTHTLGYSYAESYRAGCSLTEKLSKRPSMSGLPPRPAWQVAAAGLTLTIFSTAQSLLVEWAKTIHGGKIPFHTPSAVLYTELLKLLVSTAIWCAALTDKQMIQRPARPRRVTVARDRC